MRKRVYTVNEVRNFVSKRSGELVNLKIHLGRNRYKKFTGVLNNVFDAVFTVKNDSNEVKVFSYCDVACGTVNLIQDKVSADTLALEVKN